MKKLITVIIGLSIFLPSAVVFATEEIEPITVTDATAEVSIEIETESIFSDLSENNEYYPAILDLYERGIVEGYDDGTFRAYDPINRVETLKIIMMYFEIEELIPTETTEEVILNFSDIQTGAWYEFTLKSAYSNGIIDGYPDGTFKPANTVNLAEALKIVSQSVPFSFIEKYTIEIDPALDVPADSWYAGYVFHALEEGAVYLDAEGNLNPDQDVTRGQLADILYRFENDEYFSGQVSYGNATYYADMFEGRGTASGEVFQQALFTAAHLTLPFGTYVRVTHQHTGETAVVKVNDRGPYS
ncbi:hypothetical protein HN680_06965, partial [Candidatus Peregrinibacteria bacterium]|nr:hypothetical protein [Candidatus Peregrinibacteria bacterium]